MQNRKDLLRAHRFLGRRVTAAIVNQQPDSPDLPMRRLTGTTVASVMIGVVVCAVFGVIGFVKRGGSTAWQDEGQIVVESETGTRLVYLDGRLHPVDNFASARLIVGSGTVKRISQASMADVPRGVTLGIVGAPEQLPDPEQLLDYPWSACSAPAADDPETRMVTVVLGDDPIGTTLDPTAGVLVATAEGSPYLVVDGTRHDVTASAARALGFETADALTVGAAWLNAVPAGNPMAAPDVTGIGAPGETVAGEATRVGQVFEAENVGTSVRYFVMLADGLAPVSQTEAALLLVDDAVAAAYEGETPEPIELSAADGNDAPRSDEEVSDASLPPVPPAPLDLSADDAATLCASFDDNGESVSISSGGTVPVGMAPQQVAGAPAAAADQADDVVVPPGGGALMALLPGPGQATTTTFLVTDTGYRYPVADGDALTALGYGASTPMAVPPNLLQLIPVGPTLGGDAARTPLEVSASGT